MRPWGSDWISFQLRLILAELQNNDTALKTTYYYETEYISTAPPSSSISSQFLRADEAIVRTLCRGLIHLPVPEKPQVVPSLHARTLGDRVRAGASGRARGALTDIMTGTAASMGIMPRLGPVR